MSEDEYNSNEAFVESESEGKEKKKGGGVRETQFVQEINGFQIFRTSTSFALKLPDNRFGGYFTSLGSIFRQIVRISLTDKLLKRPIAEKREMQSFCQIVQDHEKYVDDVAKKFDDMILGLTIK